MPAFVVEREYYYNFRFLAPSTKCSVSGVDFTLFGGVETLGLANIIFIVRIIVFETRIKH